MEILKFKLIVGLIAFVIFAICITIIAVSWHPFVIRMEMDANTLEAMKSINYTALASLE